MMRSAFRVTCWRDVELVTPVTRALDVLMGVGGSGALCWVIHPQKNRPPPPRCRQRWPELKAKGRHFVESIRNWRNSVANYLMPYKDLTGYV